MPWTGFAHLDRMLLVVGRDDVTVEVALRGVTTPLAVTEWRRLPAKVRRALPTAEGLSATVTRTVREIESAADAALSPVRLASVAPCRGWIREKAPGCGWVVEVHPSPRNPDVRRTRIWDAAEKAASTSLCVLPALMFRARRERTTPRRATFRFWIPR